MNSKPNISKQDLLRAKGKTVPDVISSNLKILFAGINPGLYTAAIGHHFGRPGNRFWPALFAGGLTSRLLSPYEEQELLKSGVGITNVVPFATATAAELAPEDFLKGGKLLTAKIAKYKPKALAILGMGAYKTAFQRPRAHLGLQREKIGDTAIWVLPNPSGLNANYQASDFARLFQELRRWTEVL